MENESRQCFVCERWGIGWMSISSVAPVMGNEDLHLVICMECLSYGIKWIVMKGREQFAQ